MLCGHSRSAWPAYLRFYQLAARLPCQPRTLATAAPDDARLEAAERSAAVAQRIRELSVAGALSYPRFEPGSGRQMTVAAFHAAFDLPPADPEEPPPPLVELCGASRRCAAWAPSSPS